MLTEQGAAPIETIRAGDKVWAWNEETGHVSLKTVNETYVNEADELIHLTVKGKEIPTTPTHPFYSPVRGWLKAVDLRAGDILVLVNGEYVILELVQHEILESPVKVYNLNVDEDHTYYVSDDGVLVHNSCNHGYEWRKEREGFWKGQARTVLPDKNYGAYETTADNIKRMAQGKALIGWDGYSVQLHHWKGISVDFYDYSPVSKTLHGLIHRVHKVILNLD